MCRWRKNKITKAVNLPHNTKTEEYEEECHNKLNSKGSLFKNKFILKVMLQPPSLYTHGAKQQVSWMPSRRRMRDGLQDTCVTTTTKACLNGLHKRLNDH